MRAKQQETEKRQIDLDYAYTLNTVNTNLPGLTRVSRDSAGLRNYFGLSPGHSTANAAWSGKTADPGSMMEIALMFVTRVSPQVKPRAGTLKNIEASGRNLKL